MMPRLFCRPMRIASPRLSDTGPAGDLVSATLPATLPFACTEVLTATTPPGDVFCCTATDPAGLVLPDGGSCTGRVPMAGPMGGIWANSSGAASNSAAQHADPLCIPSASITDFIIYIHACI